MELTKEILSNNITELINATGLSDEDFALLCEISRGTLSNIKNAKTTGTVATLNKIVAFVNISIEKFSNINFTPPSDLRERLQKRNKNEINKYVLLTKVPSIPYILKFKILNTPFLNDFRERKEIVKYIKDIYGWEINPNTLSTGLKRMPTLIIIKENPNKEIGNLYKKRL